MLIEHLWAGVDPVIVAFAPGLAMGWAARQYWDKGDRRRATTLIWRIVGVFSVAGVLDWLYFERYAPGLVIDLVMLVAGVSTALLELPPPGP